jgi:hypothetical protein
MKDTIRCKWLTAATVVGALLVWGLPAFPATDGTLGLTSVGTTQVSIIKGDVALITGLSDIVMPPWSTGDPAPAGAANSCVFTSTGNYQVTASSANTTGTDFRMTDGFNFIVYTVQWNDGISGLTGVTGGTALVGRVGDGASQNCGGALPATVQVGVTVGEMNAAPTGNYLDTLTLLIAPE